MQRYCGPPPASAFLASSQSGKITCPSESIFDSLSHLSFCGIKVDNRSAPSAIQVVTGPFHQGVTLHIGITGNPLCPVVAILSYIVARGGP